MTQLKVVQNMHKFKLGSCTVILSLAMSTSVCAEQGQWKYTTGFDYSSGDYGGDPVDTEITYLPFIAAYSAGQWEFKATVPWLQIKGGGTVVGGGDGGVVIGQGANTTTTESGLGDIWLGATYSVKNTIGDDVFLDLGAKVKLPTADEDKGLGTGETDYTLQADLFKAMGKITPFATLAYKIKNDPPGLTLDNVIYLSGGADYKLSELRHIGASLDYQEAASSNSDDALELFGYVSQKINNSWSTTLYGYLGLMDGSPDYGIGLQLSYKPK